MRLAVHGSLSCRGSPGSRDVGVLFGGVFQFLGREKNGGVLPEDVLRLVSVERRHGLVCEQHPLLEVEGKYLRRHRINHGLQNGAVTEKRLLDNFEIVDVGTGTKPFANRAVQTERWDSAHKPPSVAAVVLS